MGHYFMAITIILLVLVLELVQYNKFANSNINLELPLFAGIFLEFVCCFSLSFHHVILLRPIQFVLYFQYSGQRATSTRIEPIVLTCVSVKVY